MTPSIPAYRRLLGQLARMEKRVRTLYGKELACRKGCSECCILTGVFPVEAHAIARHLQSLSPIRRKRISDLLRKAGKGVCCFLGPDGACLIYQARPVICRTHGYPLMVNGKIDFCPRNFRGLKRLKSHCILPLEGLNTVLASINREYLKTCKGQKPPLRVPLRKIPSLTF